MARRRIVSLVVALLVLAVRVGAERVGAAGDPTAMLAIRFADHLVVERLTSDGRPIASSSMLLPPGVTYVAWSFDGRAFAAVTRHDIYVRQLGGPMRRVEHDASDYADLGVAWSSRADVLLATVWAAREQSPRRTTQRHYLSGRTDLIALDGAAMTLAPVVAEAALTTWSADGRTPTRLIAHAQPPYAVFERSRDEVRAIPVVDGRADLASAETLGVSAAGGQLWPAGNKVLAENAVLASGGRNRGASIAADGSDIFLIRPRLPSRWLGFSISGGVGSHDGTTVAIVDGPSRLAWASKRLRVCSLRPVSCADASMPSKTVVQQPVWSPTDDRLAFVRAGDLGDSTWGFGSSSELDRRWLSTRSLIVATRRGATLRILDRGRIFWPHWTQDGSAVVYVRDSAVWFARADGVVPPVRIGPGPRPLDAFGSYGNASVTTDPLTLAAIVSAPCCAKFDQWRIRVLDSTSRPTVRHF